MNDHDAVKEICEVMGIKRDTQEEEDAYKALRSEIKEIEENNKTYYPKARKSRYPLLVQEAKERILRWYEWAKNGEFDYMDNIPHFIVTHRIAFLWVFF